LNSDLQSQSAKTRLAHTMRTSDYTAKRFLH